MEQENHIYIAIDLKFFYASVECVERGLDPLSTNLVVAYTSRTEKTICLAVSPSLKAFGIHGRARLFEVVQKVKEVNATRRNKAPNHSFTGSSYYDTELKESPELSLDYIVPTRMAGYMECSTRVYNIYLKYVAPEDNHVYSIDEVFIDATHYLQTAHATAREFAMRMIHEVFQTIGITATAGIGTNLYLCKIAMDIVAKHIPADKDGVRIADVKAYKSVTNSLGSGQVLQPPYNYEKARLIVREMKDLLVLDLVDKGLVTDQMVLTVGYDIENLSNSEIRMKYNGPITTDHYGRQIPKHVHGTVSLSRQTSSSKLMIDTVMDLYTWIVDKNLLVRRINITANHVVDEKIYRKRNLMNSLICFQIMK